MVPHLLVHQIAATGSTPTNTKEFLSTLIHLLLSNNNQQHLSPPHPHQQQQCPLHRRSPPHRQHSRSKNSIMTSWSATCPSKSSTSPPTLQSSNGLCPVWASATKTLSRCGPVCTQSWTGPRSWSSLPMVWSRSWLGTINPLQSRTRVSASVSGRSSRCNRRSSCRPGRRRCW